MIDPVTRWFEIIQVPADDKSSARISQLFNIAWLSRYPRPRYITYDNGTEFKAHFKTLCRQYGLIEKSTSIKNPQANSTLERVHAVVANMLRTYNLDEIVLDSYDPFGEYLAGIAWAIRSTYHTVMEATPGQLVFGRDMIYNLKSITDYERLRARKEKYIKLANEMENKNRVDHDYKIGDKVLLYRDGILRKAESPTEGPYTIIEVYSNGTVKIQRGIVQERLNIRRIKPFKE
jgi:hypothetical protein